MSQTQKSAFISHKEGKWEWKVTMCVGDRETGERERDRQIDRQREVGLSSKVGNIFIILCRGHRLKKIFY